MKESVDIVTLQRMARVPKVFLGKTLKDLEGQESQSRIQRAKNALNSGKSVLLQGKAGTGKSVTAIGIMIEWMKKKGLKERNGMAYIDKPGDFPFFITSEGFLDSIKNNYNKDNKQQENNLIYSYFQKSIFVFDDFLENNVTPWGAGMLEKMITLKYNDYPEAPMIMTTNCSLGQISSLTHPRVSSRLCEMCEVISFDDMTDHRVKNANKSFVNDSHEGSQ